VSLWIYLQFGGSHSLLADSVIGDTLQDAIIPPRFDRIHPEHRSVGHARDGVAGTGVCDPLATLTPVDVRGRIAGRFAEEADGSPINNNLVSRS